MSNGDGKRWKMSGFGDQEAGFERVGDSGITRGQEGSGQSLQEV